MADRSTILVSLHGPDRPGISAGLMDVLAEDGAAIFDVEQIVVRGRLTLNVLIGVEGERATIRDLLYFGWREGLALEFEQVDPVPSPQQATSIVTMIGAEIGPADFGSVARAVADGGANIERIYRLSRYPVVSYELAISGGDLDMVRAGLVEAAAGRPIDVAIQPDGLERRSRRMVVMDVDSTLIQDEVIDLLAAEAGVEEEVSRITAAAMAGELDFAGSLRNRVALLEGLDEASLARVADSVRLTPGARTFVRTLKRLGMKTAIVSAGFTRFTDAIAASLGIDHALSNTLGIADGKTTGELAGRLVDGPAKADFLREIAEAEGIPLSQVVAVGDGANDLDMLSVAGLGIAFNAKPVVRRHADTEVNVPFLDAILFLMGVRREHVEAADAADPDFEPEEPVVVPGTPPA